jgi:hypothetical protein
LSISVRLRNLIKRRPRPHMGWSAIEEEEEMEGEGCWGWFSVLDD